MNATEEQHWHWMVERDGVIHFSSCRHVSRSAAKYRDPVPKSITEMMLHIEYTSYLSACAECILGIRYERSQS